MSTVLNRQQTLPAGYRLLWYRLEAVLGRGSFGITYLATDTNLDRKVAVKEYLPLNLARREENSSVHALSDNHSAMYPWGLKRFIAEARTLAKFNHPNIVRVYNVFEANNTAYMAMEYEQGDSLDVLLRLHQLDGETQFLKMLFPLLDALEYMHKAGYIHRDIKPGNIFIRANGSPVLLDFGSTRMALGTQPCPPLTSLVTQGYAPYEQYDGEHGKQGPWTDIYALGATLYAAIAGRRPSDAIVRASARLEGISDPMEPAIKVGRGIFSLRFLRAVDEALKILPGDRPANIAAWRQMFQSSDNPPDYVPFSLSAIPSRRTIGAPAVRRSHPQPRRGAKRWIGMTGLLTAVAVALLLVGQWPLSRDEGLEAPRQAEAPAPDQTPSPSTQPKSVPNAGRQDRPSAPIAKQKNPPRVSIAKEEDAPNAPLEVSNSKPDSVFRDMLADGSRGPEMVLIPAGNFRMGDVQDHGTGYAKPVHTVRIGKPFAMGRYEVTFEDYDDFARATDRALPRDRGWGRSRRPVIKVTWDDAVEYTKWLSQQTGKRYRLPSEAEWEYAARGGTETAYWWGNDIGLNRANCDGCGTQWDRKQTAPVGSFAPNPFGLYDTAGNVWEWVQDCENDNYQNAPADGSAWLSDDCPERVFRGGSWNVPPRKLRSASRTWDGPDLRYGYVGFRLARDL